MIFAQMNCHYLHISLYMNDRNTYQILVLNYFPDGDCPDPVLHPTKSSPLSCTTGDNYKSCASACPSNNAITVDHPTAYTCGKLGSFNFRKPYTQFRIPACGGKCMITKAKKLSTGLSLRKHTMGSISDIK